MNLWPSPGQFRQAIEHIHRLVHPKALLTLSRDRRLQRRQESMVKSPITSSGSFMPRDFNSKKTSRQFCVDSRMPSSMAKKQNELRFFICEK